MPEFTVTQSSNRNVSKTSTSAEMRVRISAFRNIAFHSPCKGLIPTTPTNHLPDWLGLNENAWGQKGSDKANGPFSVREFSAVRVTTGFAGLEVQQAFPRTSYMTWGQMVR